MRFVLCVQSWHSFDDPHHHLLLMMDFDCPLAFRHKKEKYILDLSTCRVFLFFRGGAFLFVGACGDYIVSRCFTLYLPF